MVVAKNASKQGYTLIEMSISLSILALLIVGGVSVLQRRIEIDRYNNTIKRLERIERAISDFVAENGYIPCPARGTSLEANDTQGVFGFSNTGYQNATTQRCDGDSVANETGMVPVRTLHLADEYAYDGWEHKFTYRIGRGMGALNTYIDTSNRGDISITDLTGNEKTNINQRTPGYREFDQGAAYVIISHGPNGFGAWLRNNAGTFTAPGSPFELENTDHASDRTYIQEKRTANYDDIVVYKRKMDILDQLHRESPVYISNLTCSNARIIGDGGVPTMTDTTLAAHTYLSARMVDMMCHSLPPRCPVEPYQVMYNNLILWLDGADPDNDGTPPPNNTPVSTWQDKSSRNNDAIQIAGGMQPRFATSTPFFTPTDTDGKSALLFDGTNDFMGVDISDLNNSNYTIFVVMARANGNGNQYALGTLSTTTNEGLSIGYGANHGNHPLYQLGQFNNNLNIPGERFRSPSPVMIMGGRRADKILRVFLRDGSVLWVNRDDGDPLVNIPAGNTDGSSGAIGRAFSNYLNGYIAEILVYNADMGEIDRSRISSYLMRKWFSGECS